MLYAARRLHLLDVLIDGFVAAILNAHRLSVFHALGHVLKLSQVHLAFALIVLVHGLLRSLEHIVRLLLAAVDFLGCVAQVTQHFTVASRCQRLWQILMSSCGDTFLRCLPPELLVGGVLQRSVGFVEVPLEHCLATWPPHILLQLRLLLLLQLFKHL